MKFHNQDQSTSCHPEIYRSVWRFEDLMKWYDPGMWDRPFTSMHCQCHVGRSGFSLLHNSLRLIKQIFLERYQIIAYTSLLGCSFSTWMFKTFSDAVDLGLWLESLHNVFETIYTWSSIPGIAQFTCMSGNFVDWTTGSTLGLLLASVWLANCLVWHNCP